MQNDLLKQWTDSTQTAIASFKKLTDENMATLDSWMQGFWRIQDFAEFTKSSMKSAKDVEKINTSSLNTFLQQQLGKLNVKASATAMKDLGSIISDSMNRLMENQMKLLNGYMESSAQHMETLKQAKSVNDVISVQMNLFSEFQGKIKDNMIHLMLILEGIKTAVVYWIERSVDNMAADTPKQGSTEAS
ncbi:MAG TPA: phasin family protein [Thermodesulfovibrionia bacterium]|nr:phasin family protein [Thermodesulfovibrionia bacterium]